MKKKYEQPRLEVTEFRFSEHIAAGSGGTACSEIWNNIGVGGCQFGTPEFLGYNK